MLNFDKFPIGNNSHWLTTTEKKQFNELGYIKNLPVFDKSEIIYLQKCFKEIIKLFPSDIHISRVNNWHKSNRWVYELCRIPSILDYVEELIGSDIIHWAAHCFVKFPGDLTQVPWHQDSQVLAS